MLREVLPMADKSTDIVLDLLAALPEEYNKPDLTWKMKEGRLLLLVACFRV